MNFMSRDSLSFKNATETDYEVHGLIFADLTVYQLSNNGIGPDRIALVQNSKSNYDIYMLFEPFAGLMSFESKSQEMTTFYGTIVAANQLPWVLNTLIDYMFVKNVKCIIRTTTLLNIVPPLPSILRCIRSEIIRAIRLLREVVSLYNLSERMQLVMVM